MAEDERECVFSDWLGLYAESWKGLIVNDSVAHPAKFARGLIHHIYQHSIEEGWLSKNSIVVDPFGGIALGAIDAMWQGATWIGCELEQNFCEMAERNIELWNSRFGHTPEWGQAKILKGDSRNLSEIIEKAELCITSPPFGSAQTGGGLADPNSSQWDVHEERWGRKYTNRSRRAGYDATEHGASEDNLGNMSTGELNLAVSSPPYHESLASDDPKKRGGLYRDPKRSNDKSLTAVYGIEKGQLGAMKDSPRDFWAAARQILEQTYSVLSPNAHAIFVTRRFVKKGKIVDFSNQWVQLCQKVGFKLIHSHKAWLVEQHGVQQRLDGTEDNIETRRISFFRRIQEDRGSPKIEYDDVSCFVK